MACDHPDCQAERQRLLDLIAKLAEHLAAAAEVLGRLAERRDPPTKGEQEPCRAIG